MRYPHIQEVFIGRANVIHMQYTGLKDKNGVEIYEGDIVLSKSNKRHIVKWQNKTAEFLCAIDGYNYIPNEKLCEREVIGNIHQNPELLTPKNLC